MNGSYAGASRPSFLLVHPDLPIFMYRKLQLKPALAPGIPSDNMKGISLITKFRCSVAERKFTFSSVDSPVSKTNSVRLGQKQGGSSSLYIHPSLLHMKNKKIANRASVYELLRSIGIAPDELDGLELPVTVEFMKERVDFLHQLGLTCQKNMIPVLDYLGKLGVRKSSFTEFLRRYPQVLHASVVVDLAPVVKYLQGNPEVLGFKLEGTMSTSVAYLVGIGVARREIGGISTTYPEILGMQVGRVIKPFVEYLESLGIPRLAVARLIQKRPHILGFGLEDVVKPNVESLLEKTSLPSVVAQYPEIIGIDLKAKIFSQMSLLHSVIKLGPEDFARVVEKMPQVVSLSRIPLLKHVDFLKDCGFSLQQVRERVVGCPQALALNIDVLKLSFDYYKMEMERTLDDLVTFPAFFTCCLESTIKPRHKRIAQKGLKCSLSWLLNCSDAKFEERMDDETIDVEEMEMPSFGMNTLMEPRSDESDSDYEEDSEDEQV
ncbi:hypothetical protein P3X46_003114 [Hevea brasiliensis]|uniref:Transcription termination factor MTERF4, chloroplastic n=1 Tax=Hevea brasiliensis TaxID=3981 RepID=A0ABQ9NA31_HEVBR|nr:hypothetical protein P3X46_003114 [Hevea brasiliensis]